MMPLLAYKKLTNQRAPILIQSSLSEEAMVEKNGNSTSHSLWSILKAVYCHDSMERMHTLRDSLRNLQKGSSTVVEFARKFKGAVVVVPSIVVVQTEVVVVVSDIDKRTKTKQKQTKPSTRLKGA
ncbi:hypothetical protein Tco_1543753 [Tanacetum coccineum]